MQFPYRSYYSLSLTCFFCSTLTPFLLFIPTRHALAFAPALLSKVFSPQTYSFYVYIILFIFGCTGSSLLCELFSVAESGAALQCGVLVVVASLVAEPRPQGTQASVVGAHEINSCGSWVQSTGVIVVAHGLSCLSASLHLPDQALNPCLWHWQADSLPLSQLPA